MSEIWFCEMCDQVSEDCDCPNGPWNDVDTAFTYMKSEWEKGLVEIGELRKGFERSEAECARRGAERDRAETEIENLRTERNLFKGKSSDMEVYVRQLNDKIDELQAALLQQACLIPVEVLKQAITEQEDALPTKDSQCPGCKLDHDPSEDCPDDAPYLSEQGADERIERDDETRGALLCALYEWVNAGGSLDRVISAMDERYATEKDNG